MVALNVAVYEPPIAALIVTDAIPDDENAGTVIVPVPPPDTLMDILTSSVEVSVLLAIKVIAEDPTGTFEGVSATLTAPHASPSNVTIKTKIQKARSPVFKMFFITFTFRKYI